MEKQYCVEKPKQILWSAQYIHNLEMKQLFLKKIVQVQKLSSILVAFFCLMFIFYYFLILQLKLRKVSFLRSDSGTAKFQTHFIALFKN